jgi:Protein of unknown function (DUF2970)
MSEQTGKAVVSPVVSAAGLSGAAQDKASSAQVMKAVMWSFIGIRKRAGFENDVARIKPLQAIIAGVIGAALFVAVLVTLVTYLTAK